MQDARSPLPSHMQAPDDQFEVHLQSSEPHDSETVGAHDEAPASAGEAPSTAAACEQAQSAADGPDELKAEAYQPEARQQQPLIAPEGQAHHGETAHCGAMNKAGTSDGGNLQHSHASSSCSAKPGQPNDAREAAAGPVPDVVAEHLLHSLAAPLTKRPSLPAARHDILGSAPESPSVSDGGHVRLARTIAHGNEQLADFGPAASAKLPFVAVSCNPLYKPTAAASRSPPHSPPHPSPVLGPTVLPDTRPAEWHASLHPSNAQALTVELEQTPGSAFQPRRLFSSATRHRPWQHKLPSAHHDPPGFRPCASRMSSPAADSHWVVSPQLRQCSRELTADVSRSHLQHGKQGDEMGSSQTWHHRGSPRTWESAGQGMPSLLSPKAGQAQSAYPSSRAFSAALHAQATNVCEIAALSAHLRGTALGPEQHPSSMGPGDDASSHSCSTPCKSAELALLRETHRLQGMPSTIATAGRRSSPEGRLKAAMQRLARVHARQSQVLSHLRDTPALPMDMSMN